MDKNLQELSDFLKKLEENFLSKHIANQVAVEDEYDLDVRAYCVLAHAAFEQFFEELSQYAAENIMAQWDSGLPMSKSTTLSLISLAVHSGGTNFSIVNDEKSPQEAPLHQISKILRSNKDSVINKLKDNHGASLKYLRALFLPLGIAVDLGPFAESGLNRIASNRGTYAHRRTATQTHGPRTYKALNPEDAVNAVADSLKFCKDLTLEIPRSPTRDAYTAEGLLLSSTRAAFARAIRDLAKAKTASEPAVKKPA